MLAGLETGLLMLLSGDGYGGRRCNQPREKRTRAAAIITPASSWKLTSNFERVQLERAGNWLR